MHNASWTFISHRHKLLDAEVVAERSVSSVAPGPFVDGNAAFPLAFEQVSRLVAISTGVISTMGADGAVAPAIIGHHRVSYRTVKEKQVNATLAVTDLIKHLLRAVSLYHLSL